MRKTIGFDLDDTLIATEEIYYSAYDKVANYTLNQLKKKSPTKKEIIALIEKIDLDSITKHGFSKHRFPNSCVETYIQFATGTQPIKQIERCAKEVYNIGMSVYDPKNWQPQLLAGVKETLDFLVEQKDELHIITMGDKQLQRKKIDFYELTNWFESNRIHIVKDCKRQQMEELCKDKDKNEVWFVGNSEKSDIASALEVGIRAIHIPRGIWGYNKHDLSGHNTSRLITIDEIGMIPQIYHTRLAY